MGCKREYAISSIDNSLFDVFTAYHVDVARRLQ